MTYAVVGFDSTQQFLGSVQSYAEIQVKTM